MISLKDLRRKDLSIVCLGSHPTIVQSILDYDYLVGKEKPSVVAIVSGGRNLERYFWGESEIVIPVVHHLDDLSLKQKRSVSAVLNMRSARRVLNSTKEAIDKLPNLQLVSIFAEQTPELHALELGDYSSRHDVMVCGPSSVGMLIPGYAKLGAIGGTMHKQISDALITQPGDTAVISTSGGIVNELIHTVTSNKLGVSFAIALGGDRFPITSPKQAVLLAQKDTATKRIVFFGELGGHDEYEIAQLIQDKKLTKPVIAYVAGTISDLFETPPQFGHAKAMASTENETAEAKKKALKKVGVAVCDNFADISKKLRRHKDSQIEHSYSSIKDRKRSMMISHISGDQDGDVQLLGKNLNKMVDSNTLASLVLSMLLGKQVKSKKAIEFVDYVLRMLVDHGPYVSGAMNTIVSARAGKDLVSSLSSGLLTIGPRFGGAINEAAGNWLEGANSGESAMAFVEGYIKKGGIIPGIGHKKYRLDNPDPRVKMLAKFTGNSNGDKYLKFAKSVESITTTKKSNLILNVDGAIAAMLLDVLESEIKYSKKELQQLVDIEFFNALFVLSRSVGFTAHYLDQKRHDEGLFRLHEEDIRYLG